MSLFKGNSNTDDIWSSSDDENEFNNEDENEDKNNIVYSLDPIFVKSIVNVKNKLYSEIIIKPQNNSKNAQNIGLIETYKRSLKKVYDLIQNIKNNENHEYNPRDIEQFPVEVIPVLRTFVEWMANYFKNNTHADIMLYDFYTHCCLVVHSSIQKKELPCLIPKK